jgi:hypothetical protein
MNRKLLLGIGLFVAALAAFWLVSPPLPQGEKGSPVLQDLPWQVGLPGDGSSRVLGLHLGEATLNDAIARFGPPDGAGLFQGEGGRSLEAYFGSVRLAGLEGRLVLTVAATPEEFDRVAARAVGAERVASGATRFTLSAEDKASLPGRRITAVTYLPRYKGLEAGFFRERLGEPVAWREIDAQSVQWLYPEFGLTLLISSTDGAVFEYVPPRDFVLPSDVTLAEP